MFAGLAALSGRRVLLVEDEMLVSMLVEDILAEFGCTVVGPAAKVDRAKELVASEQIDLALLDVNIGGTRVFPVADMLAERNIPFVFMSGYGEAGLQPPHENRPVIAKPFSAESIGEILVSALG